MDFRDFTDGKIFKRTEDFHRLEKAVQTRVAEIRAERGATLRSRLRTHIAFSMLNTRLSFHGWAVKWDGSMFEVCMRGIIAEQPQEHVPMRGSTDDINQRARQAYISTGKIIDPRTGHVLPRSEGKRFGI